MITSLSDFLESFGFELGYRIAGLFGEIISLLSLVSTYMVTEMLCSYLLYYYACGVYAFHRYNVNWCG